MINFLFGKQGLVVATADLKPSRRKEGKEEHEERILNGIVTLS